MKRRFGDGPISRLLAAVFDLVMINVLSLVCSLPLFTAGAALSSGFLAAHEVLIDGGKGAVKVFFRGFKENFRQTAVLTLGSLVVLAALFCDFLLLRLYFEGTLYTVMLVILAVIAFFFIAIISYALPLITRYDNKLREHLHNAVILSILYLPRTVLMVFLNTLPFTMFFFLPYAFIYALLFWLLLGVGVVQLVDVLLMRDVFDRLEGNVRQKSRPR